MQWETLTYNTIHEEDKDQLGQKQYLKDND